MTARPGDAYHVSVNEEEMKIGKALAISVIFSWAIVMCSAYAIAKMSLKSGYLLVLPALALHIGFALVYRRLAPASFKQNTKRALILVGGYIVWTGGLIYLSIVGSCFGGSCI